MAGLLDGKGWLRAIAGIGSYKKHHPTTSKDSSDLNATTNTSIATQSITSTDKSKGETTLDVSIAIHSTISKEGSNQKVATDASTATQDLSYAEPVPATKPPSPALNSPQTPVSVSSAVLGITPPTPVSIHAQPESRDIHAPSIESSTPDELGRLEEYLKLSEDDQLQARVPPEDFLVVSADIYKGNMAQKHYIGSLWESNLTISDEELQCLPSVPAPFRPRPIKAVPRPPGYYDDVLAPRVQQDLGGRKSRERRETSRAKQLAAAKETVAKEAAKAKVKEETGKEKGKARAEDRPRQRVQWKEEIESKWVYPRHSDEGADQAVFEIDEE